MLKKSRSTSAPTGGTSSGPPFAMVGEVVCEMLIPALMGLLVDNGIYQSDPSYVTHLDVLMLLVAVGGLFFRLRGLLLCLEGKCGPCEKPAQGDVRQHSEVLLRQHRPLQHRGSCDVNDPAP